MVEASENMTMRSKSARALQYLKSVIYCMDMNSDKHPSPGFQE
jgi:hypothetical protein